MLSAIAIVDEKMGLAKEGKIPWRIKLDLQYFKAMTIHKTVLVGRKTHDEIGDLPERKTVVITSQSPDPIPGPDMFVIGGALIYGRLLPMTDTVYLTVVRGDHRCDKFFPDLCDFAKVHETPEMEEGPYRFKFVTYKRQGEMQYLRLVREILEDGVTTRNRTDTLTKSLFGRTMTFDLTLRTPHANPMVRGMIPLLTTKKVFFRGIVEELLWFLRGQTNSKILYEKGVTFWDKNSPPNGDLGPIYSYQWRHFGAKYPECGGFDQIKYVISEIKNNPDSRRIILTGWNPPDIDKMALPPCHTLSQYRVIDGKLNCALYQRSGDIGLGVPFNIASYALLTHMLAAITGLKPGKLVHFIADAHVYVNHIESLKYQIERCPDKFPMLAIKRVPDNIWDFTFDDFELVGYRPLPAVKMDMVK